MMAAPSPVARKRKMSRRDMEDSVSVSASGEAMGELFQYHITTPVSVGRGQSAMVPIVSSTLDYRKELIYNSAKLPAHPIASLRLNNSTGLTLERGPATVIEGGDYVGEAVLPFTAAEAEFIIPYAVELGVRVRERNGAETQLYGLSLTGAYLLFEEWDIRWREYQLNNTTGKPMSILVEHPRNAHYDLFDTQEPAETTEESIRFAVELPAKTEVTLRVNARRLRQRREEIQRQSYVNLQRYLRKGLIDRSTHDRIAQILRLLEKIDDHKQRIDEIGRERQEIYAAQQQIQGNMQALSGEGKEGRVRSQYVDRLEATEESLHVLGQEEGELKKEIERLEKEIEEELSKD
jgi:predicted DNA-binding transcriptional regulator